MEQTSSYEQEFGKKALAMAICCLAIIIALVGGVGLASSLVLRHIVQTLPLWIAAVLGMRRARATGWVALPLFLFWLMLMAVIWLHLLGMAHIISGHFSPIEIAMTIIVGAASLAGIGLCARFKSHITAARATITFVVIAALQCACFVLSFGPSIAHR
jgi:hypothetical protein